MPCGMNPSWTPCYARSRSTKKPLRILAISQITGIETKVTLIHQNNHNPAKYPKSIWLPEWYWCCGLCFHAAYKITKPTKHPRQKLSKLAILKGLIFHLVHNAALRGECRLNQLPADHFHHQNSPHTKNATRHESHLNALLCLRLKGLSLRYQ